MNNKLLKCDKCNTEFQSSWLKAKCPNCGNSNISKMTLIKFLNLEVTI